MAFGNLIAEARLRQEREQGKETRRSGRPFRQIRLTLDNASHCRATFAQGSQTGASIGLDMLRPCGIYEGIQSGRQADVTNDETLGMGYCLGLILGIKFLAGAATKNTAYPICVPDNAPSGQVLSVVLRYLRNHPQKLNDNFLYLIMDALLEAWPCH